MYYLGEVLDVLIDAGQMEIVESLVAPSIHTGIRFTDGQLERGRGLLEARSGRLAEAEAKLAQAATLLRDCGNPFELARVLVDDGEVLLKLGRNGEAVSVLQKARSIFIKLGAKPWLERTQLALEPLALTAD